MTREEKEQWIIDNDKLIHSFCHKYYKTAYYLIDYDDLYQCACLGAWKGLNAYDESKGVKPSSFIGKCVENEIKMEIRKQSSEARKFEREHYSLDEIINNQDGTSSSRAEYIGELDSNLEFKMSSMSILRDLKNIIDKDSNPDRLIKILQLHFDGYTQKEIAVKFELSQSYVSRIIKGTLRKIKQLGGE